MRLRKILISVATTLAASLSVACPTTQVPPQASLNISATQKQRSKRANFIEGIKKLSQNHRYIILGDSNHVLPEMRELLGDREVMNAFREAGKNNLVLEIGTEENTGYDIPKFTPDRVTFRANINALQTILKEPGYLDDTNGALDEKTIMATQEFIINLQNHGYWGWKKNTEGLYSYEFGEHLRSRINSSAGKKEEAQIIGKFIEIMDFLKDASLLPVRRTIKTDFEDLCRGVKPKETLMQDWEGGYHANDPETAKRRNQAQISIFEAACGMNLIFPDERNLRDGTPSNTRLNEFFETISGMGTGDDIRDTILFDAYLKRHPEKTAVSNKFSAWLDSTMKPGNKAIVQNIKAAAPDGAVIFYGSGHMLEKEDFNEMLGDSVVIVLFENGKKTFFDPEGIPDDIDLPEFIYNIEEDQLMEVQGNLEGEMLYRARHRQSISLEDYNRAVDLLPDDLKPFALPYKKYTLEEALSPAP